MAKSILECTTAISANAGIAATQSSKATIAWTKSIDNPNLLFKADTKKEAE